MEEHYTEDHYKDSSATPPEGGRRGWGIVMAAAIVFLVLLGLYWGGRWFLTRQEDEAAPAREDAAAILAQCDSVHTDIQQALIDWGGKTAPVCGINASSQNQTLLVHGMTFIEGLIILQANDNLIRELPAWVGELTDLKLLELRNNKITAIPDELGNLQQLAVLDLSGNPLPQLEVEKARTLLPNTDVKF